MACQRMGRTNKDKPLVKKTISKRTGQVQVTGHKKNLASSASYPLNFGLAVAGLISPAGVPDAKSEMVGKMCGVF